MSDQSPTRFAPMLVIPSDTTDISFYKKAFDAIELRRWSNDDGSIHVAELQINGALFHLHEENPAKGSFHPQRYNGVTATIGLMVDDVDKFMDRAVAAGAMLRSPATDYDYGYRQGEVVDVFGHHWQIQKTI
jgi:PhnB protein